MNNHIKFIEEMLKNAIDEIGVINVGIHLNKYFPFEKANNYALEYVRNFYKRDIKDLARQGKSSKDSVLGRLVEEVIIYLLKNYFESEKLDYIVTNTNNKKENDIVKEIVESLKIKRSNSYHEKNFDSDIIIYNRNTFNETKKIFIISAKGTTRERIGQFLSHLFLMDKNVLNAKYGKDKYEVIFTKKNILLKYAFVTLDWAENKDFIKYKKNGKKRKTVKASEVQLIIDDVKLGGGVYVLNDFDNIDGIGNFASLTGKICDFLK